MPWGAIASAIGAIGSALLSHSSAEDSSAIQYANQTKLNKQNYQYNVKLINKQNAFNERMMDKANAFNQNIWNESVDLANTAHQREVADLRAAGLNPVLSANGGAATVNPIQSAQTSSGNSQLSSSAGMPDVDYLSAMNTASNMYQQNRQVNNELKNSKVNRNLVRAQESNLYNRMTIDRNNSASEIALNKAKEAEIHNNIINQRALTQAQVSQALSASKLNYANSAKAQNEAVNVGLQRAEYQRHNEFLKNQTPVGRSIYNWVRGLNFSTSAKVR